VKWRVIRLGLRVLRAVAEVIPALEPAADAADRATERLAHRDMIRSLGTMSNSLLLIAREQARAREAMDDFGRALSEALGVELELCPECGSGEITVAIEDYKTGVTGPDGHGEEWSNEEVARCRACPWVGDPEELMNRAV
jgi:hypothetical protein